MSTFVATYNTVTISPLLSWSEQVDPEYASDGKTVTRYRHTLTLRGYLHNASVADEATDIATLQSKFRESGKTLTLTKQGTAIRTFQNSDLLGGGPHPEFSIPASDPLKVGNIVVFAVTFTGLTLPVSSGGGSTIAHSYTDGYVADIQESLTFTRRGTATLASGLSASQIEDLVDGYKPSEPSGTGWQYQGHTYDVDDDAGTLTYTHTWKQRHEDALTSAIDEDWQISFASENGREQYTASGTIKYKLDTEPTDADIGKILNGSDRWPSSLKLVSVSVDLDKRNNTLSFTATGEQPLGGSGTLLERDETVEAVTREKIRDFTSLGGEDFAQRFGKPDVSITQSGRLVANDDYPELPAPIETVSDKDTRETRVSRRTVGVAADGNALRYELTYSYSIKKLNATEPDDYYDPDVPEQPEYLGEQPSVDIGA